MGPHAKKNLKENRGDVGQGNRELADRRVAAQGVLAPCPMTPCSYLIRYYMYIHSTRLLMYKYLRGKMYRYMYYVLACAYASTSASTYLPRYEVHVVYSTSTICP